MLIAITTQIATWRRNRKFATIANELEFIYETRRMCDSREKALRREHQALQLQDLNSTIPTRKAGAR